MAISRFIDFGKQVWNVRDRSEEAKRPSCQANTDLAYMVVKRSACKEQIAGAAKARGHRVADAQCGELFAAAIEKWVVADNEGACAHLGQGRENGIEVSFAARLNPQIVGSGRRATDQGGR